jgi:hypothetical protein
MQNKQSTKNESFAACLCSKYAGNMIFRNVGKLLPDFPALHPSSQSSHKNRMPKDEANKRIVI